MKKVNYNGSSDSFARDYNYYILIRFSNINGAAIDDDQYAFNYFYRTWYVDV